MDVASHPATRKPRHVTCQCAACRATCGPPPHRSPAGPSRHLSRAGYRVPDACRRHRDALSQGRLPHSRTGQRIRPVRHPRQGAQHPRGSVSRPGRSGCLRRRAEPGAAGDPRPTRPADPVVGRRPAAQQLAPPAGFRGDSGPARRLHDRARGGRARAGLRAVRLRRDRWRDQRPHPHPRASGSPRQRRRSLQLRRRPAEGLRRRGRAFRPLGDAARRSGSRRRRLRRTAGRLR